MDYRRMPIETESPEEQGYENLRCNLTESSMPDMRIADLGDTLGSNLANLVLAYADHRGNPELRSHIADQYLGCTPDDVLVTPGAAAALFFISTSVLSRGDHAVVVRTNYTTNIETPRLIGAEIDYLDVRFEDNFQLDLERLRALVRPTTKLISITYPHNPTGAMTDQATLDAIVQIAESVGAKILVDETYRDMTYSNPLTPVASMSTHGISVSSMSKAFGLPGIRIGWTVTRDKQLAEKLLAAKEQIVICGSGLDEAVANAVLGQRETLLGPILDRAIRHRTIVADWMSAQTLVEWVPPAGGVVCFPRLRDHVDPETFYRHLNGEGGTFVGNGHWFETDPHFFRVGFGWPDEAELTSGLAAITAAASFAAAK